MRFLLGINLASAVHVDDYAYDLHFVVFCCGLVEVNLIPIL